MSDVAENSIYLIYNVSADAIQASVNLILNFLLTGRISMESNEMDCCK